MDTTLRRFRLFMVGWLLVMLAFFVWISLLGGKDADGSEFDGFLRLWHPYYFGPLYSTVAIVPALLFVPAVAGAFGGVRSAVGRTTWALTLGAVSFGLGNAVWFYYNTCSHWGSLGCSSSIEVPYPSWADAGYLGMLPFIALALIALSRVISVGLRELPAVIAIIAAILVPTTYLTWSTKIGDSHVGKAWLYDDAAPGAISALGKVFDGSAVADDLSNLISATYVVTDVLLLSTAMVLLVFARRMAGGLFFRPTLVVAAACAFQYVGDMAFFKRVSDETFFNGDGSDLLYGLAIWSFVLSVYLFGAAYASMVRQAMPDPEPASDPAIEGGA